ncbi:MAG: competence damage-inducible protein A [Thaumarchaeota archaeon]|nr:competence damage-inducible protein A [Nitrososphaerota archaeon]|tara:strand:- start:613 stop:1443 length:831 start_codon:yes stop_codon:yes gene_type:complete
MLSMTTFDFIFMKFEIISIGNELLSGRTLNTNLQTICNILSKIGYTVSRSYVVKDDCTEISWALKQAISNDSEWIIVSGGLGPTYDDMTLSCTASTLDLNLELNEVALEMIVRRYESLVAQNIIDSFSITDSRKKMAILPKNSIPLKNNVGTAPGVLIKYESKNIVCLPGVPKEMEDIMIHQVLPLIGNDNRDKVNSKVLYIDGITESELSPIINEFVSNYDLYIKSHPKGISDGIYHIELVISYKSKKISESLINSILEKLITSIKIRNNIKIKY